MAPFLEIPQTPRAKTRFGEEDDEDEVVERLTSIEIEPEKHLRERKGDSSLLDPEAFRRLSLSSFSSGGGRLSPISFRALSPAPLGPPSWRESARASWLRWWARNKPPVMVFVAQLFGALMNLAARLLELEGKGLHPFQLLFVRMTMTTAVCCMYMYWRKVKDAPFGAKEVRWLLVGRGLSGFFGIFGMWYSMMYLPLAEATVITFLVPSAAGYLCHLFLHDPFTRKEQIASFMALAGVILIARPTTLFASSAAAVPTTVAPTPPIEAAGNTTAAHHVAELGDDATPSQRLGAIIVALLGVLGGSGAFTTIRAIGERTHPVINVNYFSTWCTIVTTLVLGLAPLMGHPELHFDVPHTAKQWGLLMFICVFGFMTQFLMTAGLGGERSNRATAMVYTHMLFAAGFDKWIFGHEMDGISLVGCGLIIGGAVWVALAKKEAPPERAGGNHPDIEIGEVETLEAVPILAEEDTDDEVGIPLEHMRQYPG